jgi:hypothetical protein
MKSSRKFSSLLLVVAASLLVTVVLFKNRFSEATTASFQTTLSKEQLNASRPGGDRPGGRSGKSGKPVLNDDQIRALIGDVYSEALQRYQTEVTKAFTQFETEADKAFDAFEKSSRYDFKLAVETHITRINIGRLVGLMATDIVRQDDAKRDQAWIELHLVSPLASSTLLFYAQMEQALARFDLAVELAQQRFEARITKSLFATWEKTDYDPRLGEIVGTAIGGTMGQSSLALAVAVPAVMIPLDAFALLPNQRQQMTRSIAGKTRKIYARYAQKHLSKQATRLALASGAALADGPLPIGDILAIAFAGWTAYDIYRLSGQFQEELIRGYDEGLIELRDNFNQEWLPQVKNRINERVQAAEQAKAAFIDEIMKSES